MPLQTTNFKAKKSSLAKLYEQFQMYGLTTDITYEEYAKTVDFPISRRVIKKLFMGRWIRVMRTLERAHPDVNTSGNRPSGNTKADQRAQAATNPHGFSDAQQKAFDDMVSSGRWNEDGTVNMEWWESLSSKEQKTTWYEGTSGGYGLGDNDMHRKMKASMDEIYRSTRPASEGTGGLSFGGESGSKESDKLSGLESLRAKLGDRDE